MVLLIQQLIDWGADNKLVELFQNKIGKLCDEKRFPELMEIIEEYEDLNGVNYLAWILAQNTDLTNTLTEYGADIHINNDQALRVACFDGNGAMVDLLMDLGLSAYANGGEAIKIATINEDTDILDIFRDREINISRYEY